jgi:hypothetical protein
MLHDLGTGAALVAPVGGTSTAPRRCSNDHVVGTVMCVAPRSSPAKQGMPARTLTLALAAASSCSSSCIRCVAQENLRPWPGPGCACCCRLSLSLSRGLLGSECREPLVLSRSPARAGNAHRYDRPRPRCQERRPVAPWGPTFVVLAPLAPALPGREDRLGIQFGLHRLGIVCARPCRRGGSLEPPRASPGGRDWRVSPQKRGPHRECHPWRS